MERLTKEYHKGYQQGYEDAREEFKNTMRKYQKIKHIINDVPYLDKDEYKIASIKEIIDGNDNITSQTKAT